jgi:hypothetical protein
MTLIDEFEPLLRVSEMIRKLIQEIQEQEYKSKFWFPQKLR